LLLLVPLLLVVTTLVVVGLMRFGTSGSSSSGPPTRTVSAPGTPSSSPASLRPVTHTPLLQTLLAKEALSPKATLTPYTSTPEMAQTICGSPTPGVVAVAGEVLVDSDSRIELVELIDEWPTPADAGQSISADAAGLDCRYSNQGVTSKYYGGHQFNAPSSCFEPGQTLEANLTRTYKDSSYAIGYFLEVQCGSFTVTLDVLPGIYVSEDTAMGYFTNAVDVFAAKVR
jgi:hypothetical protein